MHRTDDDTDIMTRNKMAWHNAAKVTQLVEDVGQNTCGLQNDIVDILRSPERYCRYWPSFLTSSKARNDEEMLKGAKKQ